jgi:hypothetical protein
MKIHSSFLVLAIEARQSRFGYALFDGPKKLLDWGASMLPSGLAGPYALEAARKRIAQILRRASPGAIVVDLPRSVIPELATSSPVLRSIICEAEVSGLPLHWLAREDIRSAFRIFRARSKEQIALALIGIFPELGHRLPRKRRKWEPEKRGMIVFDAIATGLAFWIQRGAELSIP